jgi:hypothetical protein
MSVDTRARDPEIYLEPAEASRKKLAQRRRLHVVEYSFARFAGNALLLGAAAVHNRYVLNDFSLAAFAPLAAGVLLYSFVAWVVLWRWYAPPQRVDLGDLFMALDIVAWTFVIYGTGGEKSWFFFTMMVRAADQRLAGPRRVLAFGAVSVASYTGLLLYLAFGEGRAISWPAEGTKLLIIVGSNLYLAIASQTTESVRRKLIASIRVARESLAVRRDSDERYRTLFETVNDPILISGLDGKITAANRALEIASGYARDELIGRHFSVLTTPAVAAASQERIRRLASGDAPPPADIIAVHKDGLQVPYEVRTALLRDAAGTAIGVVGIYRDIRERKRIEDALSRARDAAERANRAKSQFLANMSHELRTPLNSIIGFARVLLKRRDGDLTERQASFLESMTQSATHLLQLISSVLDLARIESGKFDLALESVDVGAIARESVASFRPAAATKGLELRLELPDDVPPLRADGTKVRQVLLNLLSNAVKFTAAGSVTVTVRPRVDSLHITVRDTGPGIPEAEMGRLFEPFHESTLGREAGGSGLGLAISKSFVEMHGGNIWVETQEKQGSAFHFTLPFAAAS